MQTLFPIPLKHRRTDHQNPALELLQKLGGDKGLAKAHHVGKEDAVMLVQFFQRLLYRLLLVLQGHEAFRQENLHVILQVDVFLHVFINKLQVKLVGGDGIV